MADPTWDNTNPAGQPIQPQASPSVASGNVPTWENTQDLQGTYGSVGQQALTAVEGIAQGLAGPGATAGEAVLTKLGVPGLSPHEQEARRQANPVTSYGSEAGGFGLGAYLGTGEAAALSEIGKGAEAAAGLSKLGEAATIGQKAAQGAVRTAAEVASLQALNETSKFINQDPNQTLGSAAINVGLAGVLGGVGGAAIGSVSPMWKAFTTRAAEAEGVGTATIEDGEDLLTRSIQKPAEKDSFLQGLQKQKENAPEIIQAGKDLGIPVSPSQTSASDYVQSMDSALSQSPTLSGVARKQEIDSGFEQIEKRIAPAFDTEENLDPYNRGQKLKDQILDQKDRLYEPLKQGYAARGTLGETITIPDAEKQKIYTALRNLSPKFGKANPQVEKLVDGIADGVTRQETIADLDEYMKVLSAQQRNLRNPLAPDHYAANAMGEAIDMLDEFQIKQIAKQSKELAGQGAEHAEAIGQDIAAQYKDLKKRYAGFKDILSDLASDVKLGKGASTSAGIENVLEKIPNEKFSEKFFDKKNSDALLRLKQEWPDVFKTVVDGKKADLVAAAKGNQKALLESVFGVDSKGIPKMSKQIRELIFSPEEIKTMNNARTWIESLPKNVGPSGTPKGAAYMAALHSHPLATIVNNAKDFGIKTLLKFASPAEIEANKVAGDYLNSAIKGDKILSQVTKAFFQTGELLPKHLLPKETDRTRLADSLEKIKDPNNAMEVASGLSTHLPIHQAGATQLAAKASNYFASIKPNEAASMPFDKTPSIDKAAKAKYDRALDIANQPLMVLKHAKNGTLLPQDVQTLQALYPGLHKTMVEKLSDNLADHKAHEKPLSYQQRQSLMMIIGSPIDSSMNPQNMQAVIQSSGGQVAQHQGQSQNKGHSSQSTLSQINKVNALDQTKLEARESSRRH